MTRFSKPKALLIGGLAVLLLLLLACARPKTFSHILGAEEASIQITTCQSAASVDEAALLSALKEAKLYGPFPHGDTYLNVENTIHLNLSYTTSSGATGWAFLTLTCTPDVIYIQKDNQTYLVFDPLPC